ncbi:MFS family permease [Comamonas odontotermitis]|uniref:MFS family permease n=1 Tax=Comamonas odontotermitis TaxID=379895 RepID=A0ABR6RHM6_9BURK|nr:MFS transporter [Comamonas odontotermitis]MBB6578647.1 MFS family permease [Comamonas odontotermitis]
MNTEISAAPSGPRAIPKSVWALGFVSMFMDISSEIVHALLPVYMATVLGATALQVGLIEGIAEATASITKVFSGAISDRFGKRKLLAGIGYGLGALTKPVFPLATGLEWLVGARFVDRIGKGIRGAPRDALVADVTPAELRGAAYGLRQTLDTIGAFTGPLLAMLLMWWTANNYQLVFWLAVLPAFIAVAILVIFVKEPAHAPPAQARRMPLSRAQMQRLGRSYWWVVAIGVVMTLARFSEAFLVLRAVDAGLPAMLAPLVLVVMGIAYSLSAYPAGVLSDRLPRHLVLAAGMVLLVLADLALALLPGLWGLALGAALWGLHMGCTQGLLNAMVADTVPADLRGTAFGVFHLLAGVALLLASVIAGALWDRLGHEGTFIAGAVFATVAMLGFIAKRQRA